MLVVFQREEVLPGDGGPFGYGLMMCYFRTVWVQSDSQTSQLTNTAKPSSIVYKDTPVHHYILQENASCSDAGELSASVICSVIKKHVHHPRGPTVNFFLHNIV